jgi:hypothetical protein
VDAAVNYWRSFWRFSLRELLLCMLALGAMFGWGATLFERYQRIRPTEFYSRYANWRVDIEAILKDINGNGDVRLGSPAMTYCEGPSAVHRTEIYDFRLLSDRKFEFYSAVVEHFREALAKESCQEDGGVSGAGGDWLMVLNYRKGSIIGAVDICFSLESDDRAMLLISTWEQRGPGSRGVNGLQTGN